MRKKLILLVIPIAMITSIENFANDLDVYSSVGISGGYTSLFPTEYVAFGFEIIDTFSIGGFVKVSPLVLTAWEYGLVSQIYIQDFIIDNRLTSIFWKDIYNMSYSIGIGWSFPLEKTLTDYPLSTEMINVVIGFSVYDITHYGTYNHPFWNGYDRFPFFIDISWKWKGPLL